MIKAFIQIKLQDILINCISTFNSAQLSGVIIIADKN